MNCLRMSRTRYYVFPEMDRDDREEFFNRLNEWSYEKYEEALLESELETSDYGEEYEN